MQNTVGKSLISGLGTLRVDGGQAVVVTGAHQFPNGTGVTGGNLTADDGIGRKTHNQVDYLSVGQRIGLFGTGKHNMNPVGMRYNQFAGIFNCQNTFVDIQNLQQVVQKRRFTG